MGWLFINAGFLAAGAAALTLPIWIHLMLRQRARPMEIGSVRFLQTVVRRTKRRQRIRRWLLLALRCAAMLLLGLLFARPFLPSAPADGRTREAVVLVDRSASMWAAGDDRDAAFEKARRAAKESITALGENARLHIAAFDASGVEPLSAERFDELTTPGYAMTDYGEAFAWAADVLNVSTRTHRSLLLVTDLQASGLMDAADGAFPADIPVEIVDVGTAVTQNIAIEAARPVQVELRPGSPISATVQVLNAGALPISDVELRLSLNGPSGDVSVNQTCSLASGSRTSVRFELPITQPGLYRGQVRAEYEDAFAFDNQRFIAFEVRHPDRVLLVDGDPGRTPWSSETYFLETALRLTNPIGSGPARTFEVERLAWERGDGFPDLAGFRLIVLANLGRLTSSDAGRLDQFIRGGGSVLMFPGERTTAAVLTPLDGVGILPAE
ncbi:MAG: BatA domain-containing protein, partial [Planctomycetales bacterium]|nr:BatA domain-containing protein [Planctomycetales bacterium]